ncbi:MAG: PVC-type heme-binding CxxCH protein [Pirellulales bacterium]
MIPRWLLRLLAPACLASLVSLAVAQETPIPHGQMKPPGPALTPAEAIAKMTVPEGFSVEVVAAEPDIVNPVAMTFDERGRIWITESLEYPRRDAGPGQDRVKVLEDTDGDGRADKITVFADGLNIPSGIAVGAGGVWVANAPDILFLQDTDGDGRADRQEVVVTGFGRDDTHELPNSLTWGPDGWLYGLNGVFNRSRVEHRGRQFDFTCALFRIHPRTRDFELFAEGTSNPWGVAFDTEGSAFVSACVIDHLWHLVETGYYHRQGGPYPPFTWKIDSIVKHKHQEAAYCGIHFFDSDAYPPEYREKLYMGNIHGNCINVDSLARDGSTYAGSGEPDFVSANDAWFMPVVQKTGPDGCLYILDWYDRYHCYQDANRDPAGIDRLKGRLYRVRYRDTPHAGPLDLAAETDDKLIERLHSPNVFFRDMAQRLLWERNRPATRKKLARLVLSDEAPRKARVHALWALLGCGPLDETLHLALLGHPDEGLRAWGVRAAGNSRQASASIRDRIAAMAADSSADVRLQVAVVARKLEGLEPIPLLLDVLDSSGDDKLIPHIVWQNLHPLLEEEAGQFLELASRRHLNDQPELTALMPRVFERIVGRRDRDPRPVVALLQTLLAAGPELGPMSGRCLALLAGKIQTGELGGRRLEALRSAMEPLLSEVLSGPVDDPLYVDAALLATTWKDPAGITAVRQVYASRAYDDQRRLQALDALVAAADDRLLAAVAGALKPDNGNSIELRRRTLDSLGRLEQAEVARVVLAAWPDLEPELKPQAIELLTGRASWSKQLLASIGAGHVPADALNLNQVRKLLSSNDQELIEQVEAAWGSLRTERNPDGEQVIARMRQFIRRTPGDPLAGREAYKKVCGQCHKMHGEGQEVGPDITVNGRSSFEQLLSNVFDPSLVIGASYQARTVVTLDGRVLTGLVVEDSDQRVVLKVQGGKLETIARDDIDEMDESKLSLMPEDLEKQLQPAEIADLFAYLTLDKPPEDPTARRLPGVEAPQPRETTDPTQFNELVAEVAPGFSLDASGERGVGILAEHAGRPGVLRTHPLARDKPCVLRRVVLIPAGKTTRLLLDVSHHPDGDWQLVVRANGRPLHESVVGKKTVGDGWTTVAVDLSEFAGEEVQLELLNQANDRRGDFAYWGRVEIVSD